MNAWLSKFWRENRSFFVFIALMLVFRSAVADWSQVPTGSMKPTIIEGDRIIIDKLAYDLRLPFTAISLLPLAEPQRGDIVVFDSAAADKTLVKRVIGLPGDTVAMTNNRLILNGVAVDYHDIEQADDAVVAVEALAGIRHRVRWTNTAPSHYQSFGPVHIPAGYYLMLGDNRDNSADSRVIGLVPRHELRGRSQTVAFSLDYDDAYLPRTERFWQPL
ncbi:MAG: signal peptidase I [Pseudomonadota bacterium]